VKPLCSLRREPTFFERDDGRQILLVLRNEFIPATDDFGALLGARLHPALERAPGGIYRHSGLGYLKARQLARYFAGRRIAQSVRAVRSGFNPISVDISAVTEQFCIAQ